MQLYNTLQNIEITLNPSLISSLIVSAASTYRTQNIKKSKTNIFKNKEYLGNLRKKEYFCV